MANLRFAAARHLWRLAHELQAISTRRYAHGAELMDDLGRQWAAGCVTAARGSGTVKRLDGIWSQLLSFGNLLVAYRKARRGKGQKPGVARSASIWNMSSSRCNASSRAPSTARGRTALQYL
jgi:hypothetical protein